MFHDPWFPFASRAHTKKYSFVQRQDIIINPVNVQEARMNEDPPLESSTYFRTKMKPLHSFFPVSLAANIHWMLAVVAPRKDGKFAWCYILACILWKWRGRSAEKEIKESHFGFNSSSTEIILHTTWVIFYLIMQVLLHHKDITFLWGRETSFSNHVMILEFSLFF